MRSFYSVHGITWLYKLYTKLWFYMAKDSFSLKVEQRLSSLEEALKLNTLHFSESFPGWSAIWRVRGWGLVITDTKQQQKIPTIPQGVNSVSCFFEEEGLTGLLPNNANNVQLICSSIWVYRAVGLFKMRKFEICISESWMWKFCSIWIIKHNTAKSAQSTDRAELTSCESLSEHW